MNKEGSSSIGQRLQEIRGNENIAVFADKLGVHKNTLVRYESSERSPDTKFLDAIARMGFNVHWLVTGCGAMHQSSTDIQQQWIRDHYSAGDHSQEKVHYKLSELSASTDENSGHAGLAFTREFLVDQLELDPDQTHLFRCTSDSMTPTFSPNDWLLIDCHQKHKIPVEGYYLMNLSGHLVIRRVQRHPGGRFELIADNPSYSKTTLFKKEIVGESDYVIGRVAWVGIALA